MDINIMWLNDHVACTTEAHTHDFYQLLFCRRKGGKITVGDKTYNAKSDYVYLAKPGDLHAMTVGSQMWLIEIKFRVENEELNAHLKNVPHEFRLSDVILMKTLLILAAKEGLSQKPYSMDAANSALKLFLTYAAREFNECLNEEDISLTPEKDQDILKLEEYVEKNLTKEITLEELAEKVGYNKTYFVKKFKMIWATTPAQFVNDKRLEKAKLMLASTDMSVTEIAENTGFVCIHAFSRNFKRNVGVTPSDYRKKYLKRGF